MCAVSVVRLSNESSGDSSTTRAPKYVMTPQPHETHTHDKTRFKDVAASILSILLRLQEVIAFYLELYCSLRFS